MRAEITTSCRSAGTRYTRLNLLGWALLCPHARELLWHGSTPLEPPEYPTAREAKRAHESLRRAAAEALEALFGSRLVGDGGEYAHELGVVGEDGSILCARSKADLVYVASLGGRPALLYVEAATRIHVAKPWQALLRGVGLYYEWRLPVAVLIVSPCRLMYKVVDDRDQALLLRRLRGGEGGGWEPSPELCSLCELSGYCPYRVI